MYNFTSTEVTHIVVNEELVELTDKFDDPDYEGWDNATLDAHRRRELQENLPKHRASLTVAQSITDAWGVLDAPVISAVGSILKITCKIQMYQALENTLEGLFSTWKPLTTSDLIGTHPRWENILNTYPDENPNGAGSVGNKYGQFSPFGFDGAFWYAKVGYSF